jgi:hypothetical protein
MKKYIGLSIIALGLGLTSCNEYLDKLPDDRAEVNTVDKINKFLVSAYPYHSNCFVMFFSSDNVTENGPQYSATKSQEESYKFQPVTSESNDDPRTLWNVYYECVGVANETLRAIDEMGNPASLRGQRAEALLCRAYSMFELTNTFCMAYNPEKADEYMGVPYPKEPGVSVNERGTLRQTYENINADIEEALPLVDNNHLAIPKYHFNNKAAYAFAARFNLYYHNYDKAISYASQVLGDNPANVLREWSKYTELGYEDFFYLYIQTGENANLLQMPAYSIFGRAAMGSSSYRRYHHNVSMLNYETCRAYSPWSPNELSNNTLYFARQFYRYGDFAMFCPYMMEEFEVTDKVLDTGYPHIIDIPFTGDETLLARAEAYALKGDLDKAMADMNTWMKSNCYSKRGSYTTPTITADFVNSFVDSLEYSPVVPKAFNDRTLRKKLNPQGFTVAKGTQENLIQLILHMRRCEFLYEEYRFMDLKRYGIEYSHPIEGADPIIFKAGDLRGAIQLPSDVIDAGLPENPREGEKNEE